MVLTTKNERRQRWRNFNLPRVLFPPKKRQDGPESGQIVDISDGLCMGGGGVPGIYVDQLCVSVRKWVGADLCFTFQFSFSS